MRSTISAMARSKQIGALLAREAAETRSQEHWPKRSQPPT
jgi:hypothetical protein